MERPNVLVIMCDQLQATASHLYGAPRRHCLEDAAPVFLPEDSKYDILSPAVGGQEGAAHA